MIGWIDTRRSKIFITLALRQTFMYLIVWKSFQMTPSSNVAGAQSAPSGRDRVNWSAKTSVDNCPLCPFISTWGYIFNQLLSIEAERLLISKYEFSLSIPHCASLPLTNLDEAMTEIPKSRKDLFSHHLRIKSFTHVHLIWFSLFCLVYDIYLLTYRSENLVDFMIWFQ